MDQLDSHVIFDDKTYAKVFVTESYDGWNWVQFKVEEMVDELLDLVGSANYDLDKPHIDWNIEFKVLDPFFLF